MLRQLQWTCPGNITFLRIFPGVPGRGASNDSEVIENVDFQDFWRLRLRHLRKWDQHYYYNIVSAPCCLSSDPKRHELESPFYVLFSIFTITNRISAIRLHPYCRAIYRIFRMTSPAMVRGSRQLNCDPQNIAALRKDCGSFVDEKLRVLDHRNLNK